VIHKLQITDKDRLLAAGLMSLLVAFSLPYAGDYEKSIATSYTIVIFAVFAAAAFVFSISPLRHGSPIQKLLAVLFMFPSAAFFITAFSHWSFGR
jgi:hypothetical protein